VVSEPVADLVFATLETVDDAGRRVAGALGVTFEPHESLYLGGDYLRSTTATRETIRVQRNADLEELAEPVEAPTLVYVERSARPDEVIKTLRAAGLVLVRRSDCDAP
jgi:hypothetical protein